MKKSKSKALAKKAKKSILRDIKRKLISELSEVTAKVGKDSKKLRKMIEKGSARFAKKISKELKIRKPYSASEPVKAPIVKPEAPAQKDVQPVINLAAADTKPSVRRARVNTTLPAAKSLNNKPVPAAGENNSKKAAALISK